jgi:AAA+ superfamily predicted ATPase
VLLALAELSLEIQPYAQQIRDGCIAELLADTQALQGKSEAVALAVKRAGGDRGKILSILRGALIPDEAAWSLNEYYEKFEGLERSLREILEGLIVQVASQMLSAVRADLENPESLYHLGWRKIEPVLARLASFPNEIAILKASSLIAVAAPSSVSTPANETQSLPETSSLADIVGQSAVKRHIERIAATAHLNQARKAQGMTAVPCSFHAVFAGNPGTGKTTVARLYAQELQTAGICRTGVLLEVSRSDLVAAYMGQTAIRTRSKLDQARGGVLFIDEAYALKQGKDDTYGQECINTLLKYMEDYRSDIVVIAAGYSDEMREFLRANPGLESRFKEWIEFEDFSDEELFQIFDRLCRQNGMCAESDVTEAALQRITEARRTRHFANGREVRRVFERGLENVGLRIAALGAAATPADLCTFTRLDFEVPAPGVAEVCQEGSTPPSLDVHARGLR